MKEKHGFEDETMNLFSDESDDDNETQNEQREPIDFKMGNHFYFHRIFFQKNIFQYY